MATLPETITRMCDDLSRPEEEMGSICLREILSAVAFYESHRFSFNERILNPVLSLTNSYTYASLIDAANASLGVTDIYAIDQIKVQLSGRTAEVFRENWNSLFRIDQSIINASLPDFFATFNRSLRLYPKPNQTLTAEITAHVKLAVLTTASSNDWLVRGLELIRNRATRMVLAKKMDDFEKADVFKELEMAALRELNNEATVIQSTGMLASND